MRSTVFLEEYAAFARAFGSGNIDDFRPLLEEFWDPEMVLMPAGVLPDSRVEFSFAHLVTIHETKAVRVDVYETKQQALEAVGLSQQQT